MSDLIERGIEAVAALEGLCGTRAVVRAVAIEVLAALREPSDEHLDMVVSVWDDSLDEHVTIRDLKRRWFRQIIDAFARDNGLELPPEPRQGAEEGRSGDGTGKDAPDARDAPEGPGGPLPAHRTPGGHTA